MLCVYIPIDACFFCKSMKISGKKLMASAQGKPKKKRKPVDPEMKQMRKKWATTRKHILKKHGMSATVPRTIAAIKSQLKNVKKYV